MTGQPIYIELGVNNADKARTFYGELLGWSPTGSTGPGQIETPTLDIGIHDGDPSAVFEIFFAVEDLNQSLALLARLGGQVTSEIHDSPGFGRWAECTDDQGVRFGLRQSPTP
jgi:predicted enzyme related to lactoylglutathione lyase